MEKVSFEPKRIISDIQSLNVQCSECWIIKSWSIVIDENQNDSG